MNRKTLITATIGAIAGLGLAIGSAAFAQNTGYMGGHQGGGMMGQASQRITATADGHGTMHGQTVRQTTHDNMHGQPAPQNTHDSMHGRTAAQDFHGNMHAGTVPQKKAPATTHHADASQYIAASNPCHAGTAEQSGGKGGAKTK